MPASELRAFLAERLQLLDATLDVSPGSPADARVIQPLLRRLGADPFTVDLGVFLQERITQEFPDVATKEGDALTDLLIKIGTVLWDPIVREIQRVRNALSFRDASILTTDEAEALGANLFATRRRGDFARGRGRLYFAQPRDIDIAPANFFTSKSGLHFFPTEMQAIRVAEMLFNVEGSLYYFDVNVIAERPGDAYNLGPDELVTIANVTSAVRVTNKSRFRSGLPEESAEEFLGRAEAELGERSLVTERGIVAKITQTFPEVTRLNVVGFGDPEMQRDIVSGGALGPILAAGIGASVLPDGEHRAASRRVRIASDEAVDFLDLAGRAGPGAFTLTLVDAFFTPSPPLVRDLRVRRVVDPRTLDLDDQVLRPGATARAWSLRRRELTLAGIPGGILFPDRPGGTLSLPPGEIHIGGATDIFVRGADVEATSRVLTSIAGGAPLLEGTRLSVLSAVTVALHDLRLGVEYGEEDAAFRALDDARRTAASLDVLDGPLAGRYRIVQVEQLPDRAPVVTIRPAVAVLAGAFRWRILDRLEIDLVEPKETRVRGSDLQSIQGLDILETASGLDFGAQGVSPGDVVRVLSGPVAGDYVVQEVLTPLFQRAKVDRALRATASDLAFLIFRPNAEGGLALPLVRIASIDVLDASAQPVGSTIPYALPVDVQSRAFANVAHGIKADVTDARLGIVSAPLPSGASVRGLTLTLAWAGVSGVTVTLAGDNPVSLLSLVAQINDQLLFATGLTGAAVALDGDCLGIVPIAPGIRIAGGTALPVLFGAAASYAAADVRSEAMERAGGVGALRPALDATFDVAQVLDGRQIGFYGNLQVTPEGALRTARDFAPEAGRHVQVGARSIGSVRTYFLDPTSVEFPASAVFTRERADGVRLRYFPDPSRTHQRIPALPSGVKPKDAVTAPGGSTLTTAAVDFVAKGIVPGDGLILDYVPLTGTVALSDPVPALHGASLVVSVEGSSDATILFIHDDAAIPSFDVTRQGVAGQVNRAVGQVICRINAENQLEFEADLSIAIRAAGTANAALGFPSENGREARNDSPHAGTYVIASVSPSALTVATSFPASASQASIARQQFRVVRPGLQRICATDMAKQQTGGKLYFFDVELISEGTGDDYNLEADLTMTVTGFRSDGYFLTTPDPNLSFSPAEKPVLHLSRSMLEVGVSDDPESAIELFGQNIQIHYERSTLTSDVQNFAMADSERVVNQSPLARHLLPHLVRLDLSYVGGGSENDVTADLDAHVRALFPDDALDVSDLERIVSRRGASSITHPIDLFAVVHHVDRSITVERSQDRLTTGRLAAFVPDVLRITRRLG